ncbi:MAG TPA: benzoate-CoA ligase family protein [Syntrophales bacterium]|nr:benzoate-CoA ligase family protein [Syntrophales bacterium]
MSVGTYKTLSLPQEFNMTSYIIDGNIAEGRGGKTAIYYQGETYTFNDLCTLINKAGNILKELGVERDDRVLVILQDSPEWFASWLGTIKTGGVVTHAYSYLSAEDYGYFLNYVRPKVVVVDDSTLESVRGGVKLSRYPVKLLVKTESPKKLAKGEYDFNSMMKSAGKDLEPEPTSKDDFSVWAWSGGTTGHPKAVPHMHHEVAVAFESFQAIAHFNKDDIALSVPKLFFHYAHCLMLYALKVGGAAILFPERTTPQAIFKLVEKHRATLLVNVPTMMRAMIQTPKEERSDISSLRINFSSGEALSEQLYKEWKATFGIEVLESIGSAESYLGYILNIAEEKVPGSLGKIAPLVEAKLVDDDWNEVPKGEQGLLLVRSDANGTYYHLDHEKSKHTFLGNDWLNTGDIFRQDENDNFYYVSRKGDQIKVSGVWVSPLEMEDQLNQHEKVKECVVLGIPDKDGLMKSKAYVVLTDGVAGSESLKKELTLYCKEKLAPHKYPRIIEFMPELPKTGQGKIDKLRLRERESPTA